MLRRTSVHRNGTICSRVMRSCATALPRAAKLPVVETFVECRAFLRTAVFEEFQAVQEFRKLSVRRLPDCREAGADLDAPPKFTDLLLAALVHEDQQGEDAAETVGDMVHKIAALPVAALDNAHVFQAPQCFADRVPAEPECRHQLPLGGQFAAKGEGSLLNE